MTTGVGSPGVASPGPTSRAVDLAGPLPQRTVVLEASAGTGKTYTIAGLVTRYVAEGVVPLDRVLVVTFGRAATGELRARVRERLAATRWALEDPAAARSSPDPVVALLAAGDAGQVAERRERLAAAVASFDGATVATVHEFCQQALHALGTAADLDPGTELVEDLHDLLAEVVDDLYVRFYARAGAPAPAFDHAVALQLARAAVQDREAVLLPASAPRDSAADVRVRFTTAVRAEVASRTRARRLVGFDDLLTRLRDALTDPVSGPTACARLRERYAVVLVDEFQDTDPVQWSVLRTAFHGVRTLVLIGDPKQAIYAFRGADVRAYLAARAAATSTATLDTTWRSDPLLLQGLTTLLRGAALGDPEIVVRPVRAGHAQAALGPHPDPRPVRLRVLQREGLPTTRYGVSAGAARDAVAADLAGCVVALLGEGATVVPRETGQARPLGAGDVAVLVRKGTQAVLVRDALLAAGVPVVLAGTSSVFATPAARDWQVLLEALEQPHRTGRVRRLALTGLVGWTAEQVDTGGDEAADALALQVRAWGQVFAERGVAGLAAAVTTGQRLAERLLRLPDGERRLTDLRHVAEALHAAGLDGQLGLTGLLSWLRSRVEESGGDVDTERSRRLDTDASAVQVVTVHASKGLEFPVVLAPFGWDAPGGGGRGPAVPRTHGEDGRRQLFVGGPDDPGHAAARGAQEAEDAGEELRLLYVAVTRAVSRLVLWWAPTANTDVGPLHRLLFCPDPSTVPVRVPVPDDAAALRHLRSLGLPVEVVHPAGTPPALPAAPADDGQLDVATFLRGLDLGWRRTSYTGLTRAAHEPEQPAVGSEPAGGARDDETDLAAPLPDAGGEEDLRAVPSPMADLRGGTAFGTLVHAVLERADLSGDPLVGLEAAACAQLRHRPDGLTGETLAAALLPSVSTPLGPLADGLRLRDVPRRDLLAELAFELPLAGGDRTRGQVRLADVADLLRAHLPAGDPVAPYPDLLATLGEQPLRGYLTGSLDAVVRLPGPRYVVLDHKTNRLAPAGEPLTAWHYRRSALDRAVLQAHYPLQALLYATALHRFLRWRQPDHDPARHLGGVLYLFLRGMCGEQVPAAADGSVPGVWSWQPPAGLVVALSDLLAGGSAG